ncbi:MAG: hypoxanthine phosphoribosyltransferase [Agarilytica sp.]
MNKVYISANTLLEDSFALARSVHQSGFKPDLILGVWRGGASVAIAVQECFEYLGHVADHFVVRTSSYHDIGKQDKHVKVDGLEYVLETVHPDMSLLVVDDVFDSGRSVQALLNTLQIKAADNYPKDIRTACVWFKPERNSTPLVPDYYEKTTDDWLVFPHELVGLSDREIRKEKPSCLGSLLTDNDKPL